MKKWCKFAFVYTKPKRYSVLYIKMDNGEFLYVKDAGGGGDCFFFSVFEALKERNLMKKIKISAGTKDDFNILMRHIVANSLDKGTCDEIFGNMQDVSAGNDDVYEVFGDTYQSWELDIFAKYRYEHTSDNFCADWLYAIRQPGTWISNQVVAQVQHILKELGVTLLVITDRDPILRLAERNALGYITTAYLKKYDPRYPTIYLLNETYVDGHFKYFSNGVTYKGGKKIRGSRRGRGSICWRGSRRVLGRGRGRQRGSGRNTRKK
jgi:hypothetical protein